MKCLTIHEPFAWLIVDLPRYGVAGKDVENRTETFPDFRGWLLIHSAKNDKRYKQDPRDVYAELGYDPPSHVPWPSVAEIRDRGIIGTVHVVKSVTLGVNQLGNWSRSPWIEGPRCLLIDDVCPFDEPIPYRGYQGLFDVRDSLVDDAIEAAKERRSIQMERAIGERVGQL